ncbi:hypothetical protein HBN50_16060 [Halobacteriovorax sp. GB3]|uniref:hypothetical protein n=1 Tax=Halobacteriovorax sp. GB3 TaxID=2719615 RepID=UPI00235DD99F|nr:hypothetical protein [Halobacteriovorax sp. GB3]MDD0854628.1 hypothetical protein [Halobacteriovorax sp. GB3]
MVKTLDDNSSIWLKKAKFFLYRALTYSIFLLFPVWTQKSLDLSPLAQCLVMLFYIMFMTSQWFLLGKEIDHRLKIFFKVNSSLDRIIYRIYLGMFFIILYFNTISLLPDKWINNTFWVTWAVLGLFYSWPTRGKIIQESVSSNFNEFRYLDRFEKTLLSLTFVMVIISIPELTELNNISALKLFFDPSETISPLLWNFLTVNYFPFKKYPELFKVAWSMHFYFSFFGMFLFTFYSLLRYFVSRRLSLLGTFAIISSWSVTKILAADFGLALDSTFTLLWIWSLMWSTKSSTYRSGLFVGLVNFYGILINPMNIVLTAFQVFATFYMLSSNKTFWYRRQMLKYSSFGVILSALVVFMSHLNLSEIYNFGFSLNDFWTILERKAFFTLSLLSVFLISAYKFLPHKVTSLRDFKLSDDKLNELLISLMAISVLAIFFETDNLKAFGLMWPLALLSVLPLEYLFQSISRLRSSRNMIYVVYILICLLDSHLEGRIKIILRIFNS